MLGKLFGKKEKKLGEVKPVTLRKPEEIPYPVGRDLVVTYKQDPDMVWDLRAVTRCHVDDPKLYDFRVFSQDDASRRGVRVQNFETLDQHPELILYEGWYNKKGNEAHFTGSKEKEPTIN